MIPLPPHRPSRAVVEAIAPVVDGGRFAAKATVGEPVTVAADVFAEGHDAVNAAMRWRKVTTKRGRGQWKEQPMALIVNDRWTATFVPHELGRYEYDVAAWLDHPETWRRGTVKKVAVDVDVTLDLARGVGLVADLHSRAVAAGAVADADALADLRDELVAGATASLDDEIWRGIFWRHASRDPEVHFEHPIPIDADPERGRFSAWYEFFPRSTVADPSGQPAPSVPDAPATLRDAVDRLDYVAAMGFDVAYLPPIHPIGISERKGRNNSIRATADDVGSPWAIGSSDGGHTAVAKELGTLDDVRVLVAACRERGMELALDIAFQCSPDHPWVIEHPEWFAHRADGSIQFAENPPKQYQDIYPLDFETDEWLALWQALADVFRFWIAQGVRIFRVDNPHTKAFAFWQWAIAELRSQHPDTIFLAEAFTRPRVMERLAKIGFNQSYTYFAWRQEAWDLTEYFTDLSTRTVDFFRPNAWPNTPDILTEQLQLGGRPAFVSRAILAATLSPSWGVYGPAFELMERAAVREGSEEYLDSEKYQLREWDLDRDDSLAPLLTRLNEIRRAQPALQHLRTLHFHRCDNEQLLCYSKVDPAGVGPPVIVVVNLDTTAQQAGTVDIDLHAIGLEYGSSYTVTDALGGASYEWHGAHNYVELSPWSASAHIFVVAGGTRRVQEIA